MTPENQKDKAFAFMGLSGGILALVIALVIILPILGCIGCCVLGGVGAVFSGDPSTDYTWTPAP